MDVAVLIHSIRSANPHMCSGNACYDAAARVNAVTPINADSTVFLSVSDQDLCTELAGTARRNSSRAELL